MDEARHRESERRLWRSLGESPAEHWLNLHASGERLRVQEVGHGPPVVFVHGAITSGTCWAQLAGRLPGFRCILLDRPGCGLSEPLGVRFTDERDLAIFAESLIVDVLDALDLERADVVATSFGGYVALRSAAAHPGRIDRVFEFGWPVGAPLSRAPLSIRLAALPLVQRLITAIPPNRHLVKAMLRDIGLRRALQEGRLSDEALDWYLSLLRDTDTLRNELEGGPRVLSFLRGMNDSLLLPDEVLRAVSCPVFFLWGTEDLFGGAEIAESFAGHIPGARLELLPGAGHALWMDDPDRAAHALSEFLSEARTHTTP